MVFLAVLLCMAHFSPWAMATPQCYARAENPAHLLPFLQESGTAYITALNADGESCRQVLLYNGRPVLKQKIYVPLRNLYESYAKAIEKGNGSAARRAYAWLRPTPREFPLWLWLINEPEGAPMPWGMEMSVKMMRLLQPHTGIEKIATHSRSEEILSMSRAWPLLYLLMGGEVLPQNDPDIWYPARSSGQNLLRWRYPWAVVETVKGETGRAARMR